MTIRALALAAAFTIAPALAQAETAGAARPLKLTELVKIDRSIGAGRAAAAGDTVTMHYTGWLYAPKAKNQQGGKFDSSAGGEPFTFTLGAGKVIAGWEEGVKGMKPGGKRTLLVPASMGFGKAGLGPVPASASLMFDIDMVEVK